MKRKQRLKRIGITAGALLAWLAVVVFGGFYGWWMSPVVEPGDSAGFYEHAVAMLDSQNGGGNSALVLIESGNIANQYFSEAGDVIDENTVFSTASLSKWIAATAIMTLVQEGRISLDDPVTGHLSRWQFPAGEHDASLITIRHLLSHTAGLTDGLGFGDYRADEALPTLEESLARPRASTGTAVTLAPGAEPGSEWQYSGGGYLVLELVVEEVTGMTFEAYVEEAVFTPLGMRRSSYRFLGEIDNNAGSYAANGEVAPLYRYASSAATALNTSAADLARFVRAQIPASGVAGVLDQHTLEGMREPLGRKAGADIWGLGVMLYSPAPGGGHVFGHDGGNEPAINSAARINPATGDAIIVLATGHPAIATRIGSQWVLWQTGRPDFLDMDAAFDSMLLPAVVGSLFLLAFWLPGLARLRRASMSTNKP